MKGPGPAQEPERFLNINGGVMQKVKRAVITAVCCITAAYILTFMTCLKMRYEDRPMD